MPKRAVTIDARHLKSGIGTYVRNLLEKLTPRTDFSWCLVGSPLQLAPFVCGPHVSVLPCELPIYSLREQLWLPIGAPRDHLFHATHYNAPLLFPGKMVVTIHDVNHLAYAGPYSTKARLYANCVLQGAIHRAKRVITVSKFSKSEIMRHVHGDAHKISVIYNGVNPAFAVAPSLAEKANFRERFALGSDPYVLFVGNLKPHKNLSVLVEAFLAMRQTSSTRCKLLLVGAEEASFRTMLASHRNNRHSAEIIVSGTLSQADIITAYHAASAFAFPSKYEGFGLPLVEAMAAGTPIIAANSSSLPEVCADAALYFEPNDAGTLARHLQLLLCDEQQGKHLAKLAKARLGAFSWSQCADKHLAVYEQAMRGD